MTEPVQAPSPQSTLPPGSPVLLTLTPREFYWLTIGVWLGGIFILTLMPFLLIPRLGMPFGVACSYLLFFIAWQPIQMITQRTFGMRTGVVRMLVFVAAAASIAFYLRAAVVAMCGAAAPVVATW